MRFKVLIILFLLPYAVDAQTEAEPLIEQIIESLSDKVPEDFDFTEFTERLYFYLKHPLNINKANREDFSELIFLSPLQVAAVLDHRSKNGPYLDLLELQSVDGLDLPVIRMLLPFITIATSNSLANFKLQDLRNGRHDLMLRYGQILQPQAGYLIPDTSERNRYLGSNTKFLLRYRFNLDKNIAFALNMEKDAGEQFFAGRQATGFDFYSASLFLKKVGKIEKLALGDYSMQFGQGLALWSGLSFAKGGDVAGVVKQDFGLKPYTSVNEALYFRGAAATLKFSSFYFTPFISYQDVDASMENPQMVRSLNISGLHRTTSEFLHKNAVTQMVAGAVAEVKKNRWNAGLTGYRTQFNKPFAAGDQFYNQFDFAGKGLSNVGLHYNYNLKNTYFFGEAAHSLNSGWAMLNGVVASFTPRISAVLLHRNYDRNYHSFFSQGLAESSGAVNEEGFYSGLVIKPTSKWEFSSYYDVFRFPWLKFGVDAPSRGYEILTQLSYSPTKKLKVTARYRLKEKEENDDEDATVNQLETATKQSVRLELNYKINDQLSVRSRTEVSAYHKANRRESGHLIFNDVIYHPLSSKFSGNIRFALFDTPGFDSRIYTYENDVLYSYSMQGYQNRGYRFYINGRYTIRRGIDLWLRYSVIRYLDVTEIGSGLDQIAGNKKSDLKIQLRWQF